MLRLLLLLAFVQLSFSQNYWQQHVEYFMDINMDISDFTFSGKQKLIYTNNSPDTINKVYYHLFFNAFRPGSQMDVRSRTIKDPDSRVGNRIFELTPKDYGSLDVISLEQNGKEIVFEQKETILLARLEKPLLPGKKTELSMVFKGQVPLQIRRSGKMNKEGVHLTMTQWFPKLSEYDFEGWHPNPYIAREFHGVWGNFDVKIILDKDFMVAASGYLQNADEIGKGYSNKKRSKTKKGKITWHFVAPQAHDFTWAADPDYIHDIHPGPNGVDLHFFYKNNPDIIENWKKLQPHTAQMMKYYNEKIGPYPYNQYSVVQGGDGGMEYAMLTLITGGRNYEGLFGVTAHELAHSWFQHVLATNETKHEWMDEGFTSFISALAENEILEKGLDFPLEGSYRGYFSLASLGGEMPQSTNANRYYHNYAYERTAYSKGAVFLGQLGYLIGYDNLFSALKAYYEEWKFKHPLPNDFRRIAERVSGMQLQWYLTDWTQTTNKIDYAITNVEDKGNNCEVYLKRNELMPMPLEILVVLKNGESEIHYIPISLMRTEKGNPYPIKWLVHPDWAWAHIEYSFLVDHPKSEIQTIIIDPSGLMADIDKSNNFYAPEKK